MSTRFYKGNSFRGHSQLKNLLKWPKKSFRGCFRANKSYFLLSLILPLLNIKLIPSMLRSVHKI